VPRAKPQYPPQFKAEAVQLLQSSGSSISKIAKDLGISGTSLRNWVKQAQKIDQGEREGLTTEEREELRKLRRENKVLKQEKRDFLKKAAVDSTGERNSGGQCISWGAVSECLAGSAVEF
jgi:transposase